MARGISLPYRYELLIRSPVFKLLRKKFRTLLSIDPRWAYRFLKKRAIHLLGFYWSRLLGRTYWDAEIEEVTVRFAFFSPYHHRIAHKFHQGEFERTALL